MPDNEEPETEAPEATGEEASAPKSLVRRLLLPGGGAVLSAALAFVFAAVVVPGPPEEVPEEEEASEVPDFAEFEPPTTVDLGEFKITLADEGKEGFARIFLAMEYRAKNNAEVLRRIGEDLQVVISDQLIMHLSGKHSAGLKTTEGKQMLKLELIDILSPYVFKEPDEGLITNLYYKDFLVQ